MNGTKLLWVMIAGPYGSGAKTQAEKDDNLRKLNQAALAVFHKGHIPVIGVNNALPLIGIAGADSFDEIMMPLSLALADRCDCCLRVGGPSKGADEEVERFKAKGKPVYFSAEEIPAPQKGPNLVTPLTPELKCSDIKVSLSFYTQILGFKIQFQREESGFAMLERRGSRLMLDQFVPSNPRSWIAAPLEAPFGRGINLQMETDKVDELYANVRSAGAPVFLPMEEKWYRCDDIYVGNRQFIVQDPDGYLLRFYQDLGDRDNPPLMRERMNEEISLRMLTPNDWQIFRAVRLKALQEHPDVYLSSYQTEVEKPESFWRETLNGQGKCLFGLFDEDNLIGIAAVFTWKKDPSGQTGIMAMDYVVSRYRGRGLSRLPYQGRIDWAAGQEQFTKLVISHRDGNEVYRRANQAFGFKYTGREVIRWPDGVEAEEWNYQLDLEKLRKSRA